MLLPLWKQRFSLKQKGKEGVETISIYLSRPFALREEKMVEQDVERMWNREQFLFLFKWKILKKTVF